MSAPSSSAFRQRVGDLDLGTFADALRGPGIGVEIGTFHARIRSDVPSLVEPLKTLYEHYPVLDAERVFSFHVEVARSGGSRRRSARFVRFIVDGRVVHEDQPVEHALPTLEWGINLVISLRFHCFMLLHSAVLERNGKVLLMPALPGHGKSTLCTALAHRGWRLFSDEFGLLRPGSLDFLPLPRPIPLKNESIEVIRNELPDAVFGPRILNTKKGTVAHVRPPRTSVEEQLENAKARWIVFPRWIGGQSLQVQGLVKSEAFLYLATNAFNYELLGESAYCTVRDLVDSCDCYRLFYSQLDDAVGFLTDLADRDSA